MFFFSFFCFLPVVWVYFFMVFYFDGYFLSFYKYLSSLDFDLWSYLFSIYFDGLLFSLLLLVVRPYLELIIFLLGDKLITSSSYWSSSKMPLMIVGAFWSISEIYCSESSSYSPAYSLIISAYNRYSSILIYFRLSRSTAYLTLSILALS